MFKLREEAQQTVNPKHAWAAIGFVVVIVTLIGCWVSVIQEKPGIGVTGALIFLNAIWAANVYNLSRHGWSALPWQQWVRSCAVSLLMLKSVFPNSFIAHDGIQMMSVIAVLVATLSQIISFQQKRSLRPLPVEISGNSR